MRRIKKSIIFKDAINCSVIKEFTQIPNKLIRNANISGKAKAILCLLLSNRDGWTSHNESIAQMMKEGKEAITSGLKELEYHGYLLRMRYRDIKTKSFKGILWAYTDTPNKFDIENSKQLLKAANYEILISRSHNCKTHNVGKPGDGKSAPNNTNIKKTKKKRKDTITPTALRNKEYLPIARKLSAIIKKTKNIKHTYSQLVGWTNYIRLLVEHNKVDTDRIEIVLKWYSKHHSNQYTPIIESGEALRYKFTRLEDAIKREDMDHGIEKISELSKEELHDQIKNRMNGSGKNISNRMISIFDNVCHKHTNIEKVTLVNNLSYLYLDIIKSRSKDAMKKTNHSEDIGTPIYLIEEYENWLKGETWITDVNENLFTFKSKIFRKFLESFGNEIGLNPLTGNYK